MILSGVWLWNRWLSCKGHSHDSIVRATEHTSERVSITTRNKFYLRNYSLSMHYFVAVEKEQTWGHGVSNVSKSGLHRLDEYFENKKRKSPTVRIGICFDVLPNLVKLIRSALRFIVRALKVTFVISRCNRNKKSNQNSFHSEHNLL